MNNKITRTRVNEIYAKIDVLNEELRAIREDCEHDSQSIVDYTWGPGRYSKARVCDHCDEHLGNPEWEEMNTEINVRTTNEEGNEE